MPSATEIRQQVLACVREVVPEELTPEAAASLVHEFAVIERAAATGRMFCALRVARSDAWRGRGHTSAADWLAAETGISVREAATQLGTAKRASALPKTREAMRSGALSPTQAGAVTDGASADPAAEEELLASAASDTTAALREKAAKARAAATDSAHREARIRAERSVRTRTDADGAFNLHLRGPAIDGARLTALLRPHVEQAFRSSRRGPANGPRDTFDNRTYDAFMVLLGLLPSAGGWHPAAPTDTAAAGFGTPDPSTAPSAVEPIAADAETEAETDVDHPADGGSAGLMGSAAPPPCSAPPLPPSGPSAAVSPLRPPGGDNVKVIVRIDHSALVRGHTVGGETCDIPGLGPIPVSAARELLGDAFLAFVITKGRDVATVAHLGRGLSAHQRTAVEWLGLRCSNCACNRTVAIQVDHRNPWIAQPETKLDNQDPLCPECHRRKTHHGWRLADGTGRRPFLPPDPPPDPPPTRPSRSGRSEPVARSWPSPGSGQPARGRPFRSPASQPRATRVPRPELPLAVPAGETSRQTRSRREPPVPAGSGSIGGRPLGGRLFEGGP